MGGQHVQYNATLDLGQVSVQQALNITAGNVYPFDLFQCERHISVRLRLCTRSRRTATDPFSPTDQQRGSVLNFLAVRRTSSSRQHSL